MKKRLFAFLLCLALLMTILPTVVFAANIASGSGWYIDANGCLHIMGEVTSSGTGKYGYPCGPWYDYRYSIKTVAAESGSSFTGDCQAMFEYCENVTSIDLGELNTSGMTNTKYMFFGCSSLKSLDLSSFDMSHVANTGLKKGSMFVSCNALAEIVVNKSVLAKTADQLLTLSAKWTNELSGKVYSSEAELRGITNKIKLLRGEVDIYNIWIGDTAVTSLNRNDVLGDGTVKFLLKGEATEYGTNGEALVFDNFHYAGNRWHVAGDGSNAFVSIDRDIVVQLIGKNTIECRDVVDSSVIDNIHGIYIAGSDYVTFKGNGTLNVSVSRNGGKAIYANGSCVFADDNVTLRLSGHYGFYGDVSGDVGELDIVGNASVYCYGYRDDNDSEGNALCSPFVNLNDQGYFYAEYEWNQPVTSTWGYSYRYSSSTPLTVRGIKNIPGIVNREWTDLPDINMDSRTHESLFRALEIQAGSNVTAKGEGWWLGTDGTLHITGQITSSGTDNSGDPCGPWYDYRSSIKTVAAESGSSFTGDCRAMFEGCKNVTSMDLSKLDTSGMTNTKYMFYVCSSLKSLDLSSFDTSKVTSMLQMFYGCSSLKTLDLSSFDTSKVTNMICMFELCTSLKSLDLSSFDMSHVTNTDFMFDSCNALAEIGVNPSVVAETADQIIELSPKWFDKATGKEYADVSSLKTITGKVTLTVTKPVLAVRGDVNNDGKVNSADAVYLLRYTMRPTKYPISQSGDMNGDGKVNSADAVYLLRHTMRPSKYPLAD